MIVVVSNDPQVHRLSREVLTDLGHEHLLATPDVGLDAAGEEDVCVVDCCESFDFRDFAEGNSRGLRLYLVNHDQIGNLPANLPMSTLGVLLKPMNRSALRVSFEQAIQSSSSRGLPLHGEDGDRDDLLQSLLHAYLRLQEHENNRSAFLARVLHDFRAPVTALNGYCGLFLEDALGPLRPKQRDALLRMQRSATRLSRLALSLFELTTHDRILAETHFAEGEMEHVVEQACDEVLATCQERDISLSVELEESPGRLLFDATQIEQTVINLLENAIRFTPRRGSVELRGYSYRWDKIASDSAAAVYDNCQNSYRIDVRDFGPTIAKEMLPVIFEEYYPDGKLCERPSGGLGLAICRLIVRAHAGSIWATSGPEGTVFSFVLPFHAEASADSKERENR